MEQLEEMKPAELPPSNERPLFEEFYDDWASFDAAVARATAMHHPIRKRSSLTFEVYNRTVSKGKHNRRNIAEYLSKTFKCTHGIKFRARGTGKRLRHKLRDIGCPFHLYASAIEYGDTYRVKVRSHDKHNHPIGPDSMKAMSGALHDSDYELATPDASANRDEVEVMQTSAAHMHDAESQETAAAVYAQQIQDHAQAQVEAEAQAEAQTHAYQYAQAQAHAQAMLQNTQQLQHSHAQSQSVDAAMLSANGHDSGTLLDGTIDTSSMGDVFPPSAAATSTTVANANEVNVVNPTTKFEGTMTLESLRKRIADFAEERDWNQFHTPRNLLLALNGEVGELCEIFQWKGEVKDTSDWSAKEKEHLGEEISDVLIYLVRLADKCDVNLPAALNDKLAKNGRKYPADLVRGSSKKYNEYKRMRMTEVTEETTSTTL